MNVTPHLAGGTTGAGVIVALIDSGIRPGFPHISLDGSVIGGEDFVGDGLGFSNSANDGHGTFVAGKGFAAVASPIPFNYLLCFAGFFLGPTLFFSSPTHNLLLMIRHPAPLPIF